MFYSILTYKSQGIIKLLQRDLKSVLSSNTAINTFSFHLLNLSTYVKEYSLKEYFRNNNKKKNSFT